MVEYYPLIYSLGATRGADAALAAAGYRSMLEFSGASRSVMSDTRVRYDLQDSLYVPYTGLSLFTRPGPTLTLWTKSERQTNEKASLP